MYFYLYNCSKFRENISIYVFSVPYLGIELESLYVYFVVYIFSIYMARYHGTMTFFWTEKGNSQYT